MKKLISVFLTAILALSCTAVTFSAAETSEKELISIEMTKLPDKTEYALMEDDAVWDYENIDSEDVDVEDMDQLIELLKQVYLSIDVDLTGAEITATYSDGSTEVIDNDLCTTTLADPANLGEVLEAILAEEDEAKAEELAAELVYREYTINVAYETAETTFAVTLTEPDYDFDSTYEVVSVKDPDKNTYVIEEDLYDEVYSDEFSDEEYTLKYVDFDLTGMEVTVLNTETEELTTYGPEDISIEYYFFDDEEIVPDTYFTFGYITTDDGEIVMFDYEFGLVSNGTTPEETQPTTGTTDDDSDDESETTVPQETTVADETKAQETTASSANASTSDTASNSTSNGTVQTGSSAHAGILAVVMLSGAFVAFMVYRKKVTE